MISKEIKGTTALKKVCNTSAKLTSLRGGTSAGKTFVLMIYLLNKLYTEKNIVITIVAKSIPALDRGVIADMKTILTLTNRFNNRKWNATKRIYTLKNGSRMEFLNNDDDSKLKYGKRDYLFCNEVDSMTLEGFTELAKRTKQRIFVDYNPRARFWLDEAIEAIGDFEELILTYRDNEALTSDFINDTFLRPAELVKKGGKIGEYWQRWLTIYRDGEFCAMQNTDSAFYMVDPSVGLSNDFQLTQINNVYVSFDLNVRPYCAIGIFACSGKSAKSIAEIKLEHPKQTPLDMAKAIERELNRINIKNVNLCGDFTSKNQTVHSYEGKSYANALLSELRRLKIGVRDFITPNQLVSKGVNFINWGIASETLEVSLVNTPVMAQDITDTLPSDDGGIMKIKKKVNGIAQEVNGHFSDVFRYAMIAIFNNDFKKFNNAKISKQAYSERGRSTSESLQTSFKYLDNRKNKESRFID